MTWTVEQADCIEAMREMAPGSVHAVVTDPPYGMGYRSNMRVATPKFDHIEGDGGFNPDWTRAWLRECYRVLTDDAHLYAFTSDHHLGAVRDAVAAAGFTVKRLLVWLKDAWTSGDLEGDYGHRTEFIVYGRKGARPLKPPRTGNVFEVAKIPPAQLQHPTEKPRGVLRPFILKSTEPGEVVLDPFAGSGSTGLAAQEEGRGFVGFDIDPRYVALANERLAQATLFGALDTEAA